MSEPRPVLETRTSTVAEVRFPERIITLLAVPYESPTMVAYKSQMWRESFARGAFDGAENRVEDNGQANRKIRVNREHRKGETVGKVVALDTAASDGLVAEIKVVSSAKGDETLALAAEDMISASIGFAVRNTDQELNRSSAPPTRYIRKALLDHIGLVEDPAYTQADVLSVRDGGEFVNAASLPELEATPALDEWMAYLAARRAGIAS